METNLKNVYFGDNGAASVDEDTQVWLLRRSGPVRLRCTQVCIETLERQEV